MTTLGDLIENTRHKLSGLDASKDAVSALSAPISATDTNIPLDDLSRASAGVVEIDFELIRVRSVQQVDGKLIAWSFGRGYRATPAVAHEDGVEVRFNPDWPASTVAYEINRTIDELYPALYAVQTVTVASPSDFGPLTLPDDVVGVIAVHVEDITRPGVYVREDRWSWAPDGSDAGRTLWVGGGGRVFNTPVRVTYAARPRTFDLAGSTDQDFTAVTLLDNRVSDLIALGVARRLATFIDVSKLPYLTAAAADASGNKTAGQAGTTARLLHSMYQARLAEEAAVLKSEHPIRVHRTR